MRWIMQVVLGIGIGLWLRDIFFGQPRTRVMVNNAPDTLTEIAGIGPVFEAALHEIGIHTFAQLGRQNADTLAENLGVRVPAERIRRERWIEQAQERS